MVNEVYTLNFYLAVALGIIAIFIIFLLVYLVFFKKPEKNKFDPKESLQERKKKVPSKDLKKGVLPRNVPRNLSPQKFTSPNLPVRRPMPGYNLQVQNKKFKRA